MGADVLVTQSSQSISNHNIDYVEVEKFGLHTLPSKG